MENFVFILVSGVSVDDSTFGEIVGRDFYFYLVSQYNSNVVHLLPSGKISENFASRCLDNETLTLNVNYFAINFDQI